MIEAKRTINHEINLFMQFVGVMYALILSLVLVATFLSAYTTETKEILVTINTKGEAAPELILFIILMPIITYGCLKTMKDIIQGAGDAKEK